MKRIVVFGATGGVGAYFIKYATGHLDRNEYEIIPVGRRQTGFFESYGLKYYSVDISNSNDFMVLPEEDVHAVILLAAQIPTNMLDYDPSKYVFSNIVGTFNVLEYCKRVKIDRLLFTTSISDSLCESEQELDERYPHKQKYVGDHAMYAISKNCGVEMIEHYFQEYGIKRFVFRLPTIYYYSPDCYWNSGGIRKIRPLYKFIELAEKGAPIELWGDKNSIKEMVHVYDLSQMLCNALMAKSEGGFFNVGNGFTITLEQEIETIIDIFSKQNQRSSIIYRPEIPSKKEFIMKFDNAIRFLDYKPWYDCERLMQNIKEEKCNYSFAGLY